MNAESNASKADNTEKRALIDTACEMLLTYGVWDYKTKCKRFIKKNILRRHVTPEDSIFWPTAILAAGLCKQREQTGLTQIDETLSAYYRRWMKKKMPIVFLDDLLAGETLLSMYVSKDMELSYDAVFTREAMKEGLDKLAEFAGSYPIDEAGSFPYRANQNNGYVFVDMIGLVCPFLYRYGELFGKKEYMEMAIRQIANYLAYGMDSGTYLPYHGYDMKDGCKYGIIGWGRAVGWLLRGMAGCVRTSYGRERLEVPFKTAVDAAISYQRSDGYFSWQLQAVDGPMDTSAMAMILAAVQDGIAFGVLDNEKYTIALENGKKALQRSIRDGNVYDCSGECEGFSVYPQRYGAYPWGIGAALQIL